MVRIIYSVGDCECLRGYGLDFHVFERGHTLNRVTVNSNHRNAFEQLCNKLGVTFELCCIVSI
jgi:hypothetical protein